jgi:hypothetical protein
LTPTIEVKSNKSFFFTSRIGFSQQCGAQQDKAPKSMGWPLMRLLSN